MARALSVILAAALLSSTASDAQTGRPTIGVTRWIYAPGDIRPEQLRAEALRVRSLKVESPRIRLRIGDTLSLDTVIVVAYDSAGTRIGRLRTFDARPPRGAFVSAGVHHWVAILRGTFEATLNYPSVMWAGRSDRPVEAMLRIDVIP